MSQWIAGKLQSSITKNMVFPSCSDIPLPFLLGLDHADVGFVPPALLPEGALPLFRDAVFCLPVELWCMNG